MLKLLTILFICTLSVIANDIRQGYTSTHSRKIFGDIKEANSALWRRTDDIVINAPNNEIITAVYVTDLRENKDGEAVIESGGVGGKSVTIGIRSPSILRGYKFEIEVFSEDPNSRLFSKGGIVPTYTDTQFARKY
ncbi:unnamed protein product, partial [Brenthis ino]